MYFPSEFCFLQIAIVILEGFCTKILELFSQFSAMTSFDMMNSSLLKFLSELGACRIRVRVQNFPWCFGRDVLSDWKIAVILEENALAIENGACFPPQCHHLTR